MFCALLGQAIGERLQDHWSSGFYFFRFFISFKYDYFSRVDIMSTSDPKLLLLLFVLR